MSSKFAKFINDKIFKNVLQLDLFAFLHVTQTELNLIFIF